MSNNFAVYYNNFDEENNFLRAQSSQVQKYSSNLNQHFDTIPEKDYNRRFTHNFYPEINPVFSSNNDRRNTISDLPFPNDSMINEDTSSNTDKIPQEFKIKKVTKIKPKIKDGVRNNRQNLYNTSNINQKASKDVFSENLAINKKSPLDDISGNSSDIPTLKPNSQKLQTVYNKNTQNKKMINHNFPINERLKNQFINRNLDISEKLNRINFLQNLEKECQNRMLLFEKEFKSDIYFKKRDFFNNVFLNNYEIGKNLPLTFIFYYLFDPKKEINQLSIKKNFLESVLNLHGYKNIKMIYDEKILNTVPKYFNDLNYVNTLFQTFEINKLNRFNNEIKNWIKTFELEIVYEDLNNNIINDKIKIYLISPKDIIIEYSNSLQSFAEYNFHCDISYDKEKGRFAFKTIANVYNKCQDLSQFEFLGEMWERAKVIIIDEAQKNKIKVDKIFKEYLKKTLYKYKTSINHITKDIIVDEEKEKLIDKIPNNKRILHNNNIRNYKSNEINKENEIVNNDINKIKNETIIEKLENKKEIKIINNRDKVKEQILFYGVLLSFFIFIFKTVLSIELGTYSFETFFNILIIIIIGFMLFKTKSSNQA